MLTDTGGSSSGIDVTEIIWEVTPHWDPSLKQTVKVQPSPPAAMGSTNLPVPPGAVRDVTVTIAGKATTQGGKVNGLTIPPQSFSITSRTEKVTVDGTNKRITWMFKVATLTDQYSFVWFEIDPLFWVMKAA